MVEGSLLAWYQGLDVMECLGANPINKAMHIFPLNILFVIGSDSLGDVSDTSFEEPVAKVRLASPEFLVADALFKDSQSVCLSLLVRMLNTGGSY
jgi:hypothetical protein